MSDKLTASEVSGHLARKGASPKCPACGNERFGHLRGPAGAPTLRPEIQGMPDVYALACLNCGLVQWHVAALLDGVFPDAATTSGADDER